MEARDGSSSSSSYIGIEVGGRKLQVFAGDATGAIQRRWRTIVDPRAGGEGVQAQLKDGLSALMDHACRPRAVGVGFGGPVDVATGRISRSHQIDGWEGFALRGWLEELT